MAETTRERGAVSWSGSLTRGLPGIPRGAPVAGGVRLPGLPDRGRAVPHNPRPAGLPHLPAPGKRHRRDDLREDPHATDGLVRRRLVPDQPEARSERPGSQARARPGQLPDRLDRPAQAASSNGCAPVMTGWVGTWRPTRPTSEVLSWAFAVARPTRRPSWRSPWRSTSPRGSGAPGSAASPMSRVRAWSRSSGTPWNPARSSAPMGGGATTGSQRRATRGRRPSCRTPGTRPTSRCRRCTGWRACSGDGLLGTHHGLVGPEQHDHYLDEFTFRFNRRTSRSRGLLFYRLLEQAVVTDPATYALITRRNT